MNASTAAPHQVTIKNLKHSAFASQETHCFEASVYIDGKRKGVVSNSGQGGPDEYEPRSLFAELDAIAKTMPPIDMSKYGVSKPLPCSAEILIGDLVNAELSRKKIAGMVAKKTWFRKPGQSYQPGEWTYLTTKTSPESIAAVQKKYGADTVILGHNHHSLD